MGRGWTKPFGPVHAAGPVQAEHGPDQQAHDEELKKATELWGTLLSELKPNFNHELGADCSA